jgi:hypothetical protein
MIRNYLERVLAFGFVGACVWLCLKSNAAVVAGDHALVSITVVAAAVLVASIVGTFSGEKR